MEGLRAGATVLHTAVAPLARGTSQPSAETTLGNIVAAGYSHQIDEQALAEMSAYFTDLAHEKQLPVGVMPEYDEAYYRHQLPGGMATTVRRQLEEMRRPELFDAALVEVERVRAELGYPIMVTPLSQFVTSQAVMNVLSGQRYSNVPDEVVRYLLGQFGQPPAPPDPEIADRVLALPRARELSQLEPLSLDGARARLGRHLSDEELLLRLTMPEDQVDAMKAASSGNPDRRPRVRTGRSPVVRLLRELDSRPAISYLRLEKADETIEWRRGAGRSAG
jgi:oxaloacetate decarboxylase alpha subunit